MPSQREHRCPHNGKQENRYSQSECDDTHPALLELCRGVGEEKHCGEQNSIREVLTGNTPAFARFISSRHTKNGFAPFWWAIRIGAMSWPGLNSPFRSK